MAQSRETSDAARHRHHPPPDRRAGETFPPRRADTLCVRGASLYGCGGRGSGGVRQRRRLQAGGEQGAEHPRHQLHHGQVARGAQRLGPEGNAADGAEQRSVRGHERNAEVGGDVASQSLRQRGVLRDGGRHGRHARRPALGHRPAEASSHGNCAPGRTGVPGEAHRTTCRPPVTRVTIQTSQPTFWCRKSSAPDAAAAQSCHGATSPITVSIPPGTTAGSFPGSRRLNLVPVQPANSRTGRPATPTSARNIETAIGSSSGDIPSRDVVMNSWSRPGPPKVHAVTCAVGSQHLGPGPRSGSSGGPARCRSWPPRRRRCCRRSARRPLVVGQRHEGTAAGQAGVAVVVEDVDAVGGGVGVVGQRPSGPTPGRWRWSRPRARANHRSGSSR